ANSFISEPETSWIMPRPYWASGPDRSMSWLMRMRVPLPLRSSDEITVAAAWPLPFISEPLAFITIRLATSSRSVMSTSPLNDSDTGPILMLTFPLYWWSLRTSVSSAPGMQGATRRGSSRNSQTSSVEAGTVNSFSRWIAMPLLLLACFETRQTPGAAEVVRRPVPLEPVPGRGDLHSHAAHGGDGLLPGRRIGDHGAALEAAGGPELDQFGQDRHRDLLVGDMAQVEPGGSMHPVERLVGESPASQVAPERLGPPMGGDDPEPAGRGADRLLQHLLVIVALGGHHQSGAGPDADPLEVKGRQHAVGLGPVVGETTVVDHRRPPAERPGHGDQRVDHRGKAGHDGAW